ncbi:MAG: Uma2 family endonuclease [Bryobacterales bacterium]|nr:Uma2 family endonuclease [Bryobacterales bacterium]
MSQAKVIVDQYVPERRDPGPLQLGPSRFQFTRERIGSLAHWLYLNACQSGLRYHIFVPTQTLVTFEQFEKYQDDGQKHELMKGEHVVLPPPKFSHTRIQHHLLDLLRSYVRQHQLGDVMIEAGFRLSSDTWVQPDVSFVRTSQMKKVATGGYLEGAPALAVEVASESNTAAQLDLKMELYFAHGAEEIWIIYPQTSRVRTFFPDGHGETLANGLKSGLFPGWSAPLSAIFTE